MARILVLCSRIPYPLTDGAKLRMYNTARILNQEHTVDLLIINEGKDDQKYVNPLIDQFNEVTLFTYPSSRFYLNSVRGIFSHRPLQTFYYSFHDVHHWLASHRERYDLFYCNHACTAEYVRNFDTLKVIDLVDAVSRTYARAFEGAIGKWRLLFSIESKRLLPYEREIIQEFDHSFLVSPVDQRYLEGDEFSFSTLSIIPNGVKEYLLSYPLPSTKNKKNYEKNWILFLGAMDTFPNADAATYFANKIFPIIRKTHPEVKFLVVGKNPIQEVQKLGEYKKVYVTGFVEDPAEYLRKARVIVAPMRFGSGIKNKILEAMALGKPVVTTPRGIEGLAVKDGIHLRIADSPKTFANTVVKLLGNPKECTRLGQNARKRIKEKYTWENVRPKLLRPIQNLIEGVGASNT